MGPTPSVPPTDDLLMAQADAERLARLESRISRIEARLGIAAAIPEQGSPLSPEILSAGVVAEAPPAKEFEFELGHTWFAAAGAIALTVAAASFLTLPFPNLPAVVPPLLGYVI